MDQQLTWKDLIQFKEFILLFLSGFAFTYVIGYFYAFDLAWFPFFSIIEHIIFAIRALPVAVAALAGLLLVVKHPSAMERVTRGWIYVLWITAMVAIMFRYPSLAVLAFVGVATSGYLKESNINTSSVTMIYLLAHMMIASIITGFIFGTLMRAESVLDKRLPLILSRSMHIHFKPSDASNASKTSGDGHIIFVGSERILFFDYASNNVYLYPWSTIEMIHERQD